jgi:hypothetical protein
MTVFVLKTGLVDECLDEREHEVARQSRTGNLEDLVRSDKLMGLWQEVGKGRRNENPGCHRHERMQPVSETQRRDPAGECREEGEECCDRHSATLLRVGRPRSLSVRGANIASSRR